MSVQESLQGLYDGPGRGVFYSPFTVKIDPMQRLLLINLEKDPDQLYIGFEPQVFDDPIHGSGMLVIAYRHDNKVDVYHQPGLKLNPKDYAVVRNGLENLVERHMRDACFDVYSDGLDVSFSFEDILGRSILVEVHEDMSRPRRTFPILAPLGTGTENPPGLPLFFLYDFGFVRRSGTQYKIEIDRRFHRLDGFPLPIAGERVYFTRYTTDPLIMTFNPTFEGELQLLPVTSDEVHHAGVLYTLVDQEGHPEIQRMRVEHANAYAPTHTLDFYFDPPFPDLTGLHREARMEGIFTVCGEESIGRVSGSYAVWREGDLVRIRLHPGGGWQPNESRWSIKIIFIIAKVFRSWPTTYEWNAEISTAENGETIQKSAWQRLSSKG
jgi:hypothetical protein